MSIGNQLQELGLRFVRHLVQLPAQHLLGFATGGSRRPPGSMPGTLFIDDSAAPTRITAIRFDGEGAETLANPDVESLRDARRRGGRLWVDITGFANDRLLRSVAREFGLHPLVLADLVNGESQSKTDTVDDTVVVITQIPQLAPDSGQPGLDHLGLVLGPDWLLTFRERRGDLFAPVHDRLEQGGNRLRTEPLDYLAYALLDVAVDSYFPVIEALAARIDQTEDAVLAGRGASRLNEIHDQRRALIALGRLCWRQRDLIARLLREETLFREPTRIYLRDVHDRTIQLQDMVDATRELAASLIELHLSISANRSNRIMQTLTTMASIFIPLTFIAGIYGMNFEFMPELAWPWGYPAVLGLMLVIALGMVWWLHRRHWLDD